MKDLLDLADTTQVISDVDNFYSLLAKKKEGGIALRIPGPLEVELQTGKYTILSQKSVYIGDIGSNDFDVAEFKVLFKENSPSAITLPLLGLSLELSGRYTPPEVFLSSSIGSIKQ